MFLREEVVLLGGPQATIKWTVHHICSLKSCNLVVFYNYSRQIVMYKSFLTRVSKPLYQVRKDSKDEDQQDYVYSV